MFAIVLGNPESGTYTIKCLNKEEKIATSGISKISLVSTNEVVHWKQTKKGLTIEFPLQGINDIANAFRIEIKGMKPLAPKTIARAYFHMPICA